jgi:pimeloyl-ACP methyl ester carboxylesterase
LGQSFGGSIEINFALSYPSRLKGLILPSHLMSKTRWIEDSIFLQSQIPQSPTFVIEAALSGDVVAKEEYDRAKNIFITAMFVESIHGRKDC